MRHPSFFYISMLSLDSMFLLSVSMIEWTTLDCTSHPFHFCISLHQAKTCTPVSPETISSDVAILLVLSPPSHNTGAHAYILSLAVNFLNLWCPRRFTFINFSLHVSWSDRHKNPVGGAAVLHLLQFSRFIRLECLSLSYTIC